ncbi:MAG: DUF3333 domain-containing protein, partial [Sphingomonas parapaucimobilis]
MNKPPAPPSAAGWNSRAMARRLRRRYAAERRFRRLGAAAVALSAAFLAFLLITMLAQGLRGFTETRVAMPVNLAAAELPVEPARLKGRGADLALAGAGLENAVDTAATTAFGPMGTDLLSPGAWLVVRDAIKADPGLLRRPVHFELPVASRYDVAAKGIGTP